jgi:hypothetical protein
MVTWAIVGAENVKARTAAKLRAMSIVESPECGFAVTGDRVCAASRAAAASLPVQEPLGVGRVHACLGHAGRTPVGKALAPAGADASEPRPSYPARSRT